MNIRGNQQLCFDNRRLPAELHVQKNARLELTLLLDDPGVSPPSRKIPTTRIIVDDGAAALLFSGIFTSAALEIHGILQGNNAIFEHHVAYGGQAHHTVRLHLSAEHRGSRGMSRIMSRGVVTDQSHAEILGSIAIAQTGQGADGRWEHEGLLLSKRSRIDALPGLSIDTYNVKASHSSAIHFIRPEQLFYAQTRGIAPDDAREMIVQGFLAEMLTFVHDPVMHRKIYGMIRAISKKT